MDETAATNAPGGAQPLAGAPGWIITEGRAGMVVQARGVADALGLVVDYKEVHPRGFYRLAAPWGPVDPAERFGQPGSRFAPPWPAVAIACGRASIPYIRLLKRKAGARTFTVVLQDPRSGPRTADLIWVPEHDRLRGPNVITTLVSPHGFPPERIAALRSTVPPEIAALPEPRVAVILGGRNAVYRYSEADHARLEASLRALAALGVGFMVTPSRRSHPEIVTAAERGTSGARRIFWDGSGDNPYPQFLAHADAFVVTGDSVNMAGEACATGRPVWIFEPAGGSAKFSRYHDALRAYGATRPLPERMDAWQSWSYRPLHSAHIVAAEIERRWQRRLAMVPGLMDRQGDVDAGQ